MRHRPHERKVTSYLHRSLAFSLSLRPSSSYMAGRQEAAPSGVRGLNSIRRPLPSQQGERASLSDEQHSEADGSDWERVSVSGSVCGSASEAGDDATVDALVEDFQDVGFPTIGEESTSAGGDRLPEYDATLARRPTTPSSLGDDKSLAELLCQGPFARRPRSGTRGRNTSFHAKRQQWRVAPSGSSVPMAAASAPAAK